MRSCSGIRERDYRKSRESRRTGARVGSPIEKPVRLSCPARMDSPRIRRSRDGIQSSGAGMPRPRNGFDLAPRPSGFRRTSARPAFRVAMQPAWTVGSLGAPAKSDFRKRDYELGVLSRLALHAKLALVLLNNDVVADRKS